MMNRLYVIAAGFLLSAAAAQDTSNYPDFDPNDVEPTERMKWCTDQQATCDTLCAGSLPTVANGCDHNTLLFSCICKDNTTPEFNNYIHTINTYECEWNLDQCKKDGGKDCEATIGSQCGTLDPATGKSVNENDNGNAQSSTTKTTKPTSTSTASHTISTPSASHDPSSDSDDGSSGLDTSALIAIIVVGLLVVLGLVALLFFKLGNRRNRAKADSSDRDQADISGSFEKLNDDPSTPPPQVYEMAATPRGPVELDSSPWTGSKSTQKVLPSEFPKPARTSHHAQPVELDSRMMPLDIKIEPGNTDNNNTKYRF